MYIWQKKDWIKFKWDSDIILELLAQARKKQGFILAKGESFNLKDVTEFLITEAVSTSKIEGEIIDPGSVRSSIAKRLGLPTAGFTSNSAKTDGLVEILLDATLNYSTELSDQRIWGWHAALFPTGYSGINKIDIAKYRTGSEPMEVVSGKMGDPRVHYRAPDSSVIPMLMDEFVTWWNHSNDYDGLIKAAITHLYFVTLHPFDDGNGRIARILTDMTLAKDENNGRRLYSLSAQIIKEKNEYYRILEETQKGNGNITNWLIWFLNMFIRAIDISLVSIEKSMGISKLKSNIMAINLSERQVKVMNKLIEAWPNGFKDGITNKKYVVIAKTTPETAKRDLKKLVELNILEKSAGGGRSTSYKLVML